MSWTERPDMADGCAERLDLEFLRYVWRFHAEARPRLLERLAARGDHVRLVTLRHPRQTRRFVAGLAQAAAAPTS